MAFTQQTRVYLTNGEVKEERIERYDPSLPDIHRWRLIEFSGHPATDDERKKWESRKNGRPKTKVDKAASDYLDLEGARLVSESPTKVRFKVAVRPNAQRLLAVDKVDLVITVDKQTGGIAAVGATLSEPIRALFGLVRITDLAVDLRLNSEEEVTPGKSDDLEAGSTARVTVSRLGKSVEYDWSEFERVEPYRGP